MTNRTGGTGETDEMVGFIPAHGGFKELVSYQKALIESDDPEIMANTMICLINQTCFLLKRQIQRLEKDFVEHGGIRERMTAARLQARDNQQIEPGEPVPVCPQCGAPMQKRTARTGRNAGKAFRGCSTYPDCRGTREVV